MGNRHIAGTRNLSRLLAIAVVLDIDFSRHDEYLRIIVDSHTWTPPKSRTMGAFAEIDFIAVSDFGFQAFENPSNVGRYWKWQGRTIVVKSVNVTKSGENIIVRSSSERFENGYRHPQFSIVCKSVRFRTIARSSVYAVCPELDEGRSPFAMARPSLARITQLLRKKQAE